ncbi:MAG TPA: PqqD family protein [Pseudolabrys sp.]|nr:PqqD family protein [Pseudolabrys sp.]
MSLSLSSTLVQETGLSATEVDGRIVVLSLKAGSYFDLNKVASEIWAMLSTPRSIKEILQELSLHYRLEAETPASDVIRFLQLLLAEQLVRCIAVEKAQ